MSLIIKVAKGASWLALFKLVSQVFSWVITILVARILVPEDYGLMEMSTIFTGYAMMFSELGLGAAIIQRQDITTRELSSIFWFNCAVSVTMALGCIAIAYPTAYLFHEERVIPLTQAVSILFILTGLQIVPMNLLKKGLEFKKIGMIEMTGVVVSCVGMYVLARMEAGVWTLLGGHIIREFTKLLMVYSRRGWIPEIYFSFNEVRSYLGFGLNVAVGRTLFYVYDKSDKFFAGKAWPAQLLGYYSFALDLAKIPTEKIVTLINQVSFPAFAQLQGSNEKYNDFFLNITKIMLIMVLPIFVGGFLVGEDLIRILLDSKWLPIVPLFKFLCLAQIFVSLTSINNIVHIAQGRPWWSLYFNAVCAVFMPVSFYLATRYTLEAMLVPWFSTYLVISIAWCFVTLSKMGIGLMTYARQISSPVSAVAAMTALIMVYEKLGQSWVTVDVPVMLNLAIKVLIGAIAYIGYVGVFDRQVFATLRRIAS